MVKQITSKSNELIKDLIKLKQKKNRTDTFLIEGERMVCEALKRNISINALLFVNAPDFVQNVAVPCYQITEEIAESLTDTVNASGVFAVVLVERQEFRLPEGNFLVLDHIQDPGNLGTIIRSALSFDFKDIYLYNCVDWRNAKVLRSTMGTVFDVRLQVVGEAELQSLAKLNLYCADMAGENVFEFTSPKSLGLVLGNEANGVSKAVEAMCKGRLCIPMKNEVESLNVAVAGAILMSKLTN